MERLGDKGNPRFRISDAHLTLIPTLNIRIKSMKRFTTFKSFRFAVTVVYFSLKINTIIHIFIIYYHYYSLNSANEFEMMFSSPG